MKKLFYTLAATTIALICVVQLKKLTSTVLRATRFQIHEYSTHIHGTEDSHNRHGSLNVSTSDPRPAESGRHDTQREGIGNNDILSDGILGRRRRGKKYLLIYNNVPKCGSRSLAHSIGDVLKRNGNFHGIKVKGDKQKREDLVKSFRGVKVPAYISGHMPFVVPQRPDIVYVNMVRDPIERFVSLYYFALFGDENGVKPEEGKHRKNITIDEYVEGGGKVESRIFLHFDDPDSNDNHTGSSTPLERAKANIERYFILVGLTEELENTVALLGELLPGLLHGIDKVYKDTVSARRHGYSTMNKIPPSNNTVSILREQLSAEYDLYHFVKQRFAEVKKKFGIT